MEKLVYPQPEAYHIEGMTLREYFIGQALMGFCSVPASSTESIAQKAIEQGNAVIRLLEGATS
jgi:hypothetical protein